ncbi:hypothetical protein HMPREF0083_04321 [Aneurinibacillus aneurinilyticus ATCC 12856]|uniref:Uncharacterized protein n=1 Tax=Aneurinibacillus aneurinilyticus ATCC 12856 TaxID=649747 RepID=U1WG93_ANEAE|nr:hypothetical protein HMPREF0083_04321 [Aneurinibacillus aneurinilyticus ATCC 12856]
MVGSRRFGKKKRLHRQWTMPRELHSYNRVPIIGIGETCSSIFAPKSYDDSR